MSITKVAIVELTKEEIDSPEPIDIILTVKGPDGDDDMVDYTITYTKD